MIVRALFVATAIAGAVACGPKVETHEPTPFEREDPRAGGVSEQAEPADVDAPATESEELEKVRVNSGTVSRKALLAVLDEGVQPFLTGVSMEAYFENKRFAGWRIEKFWPGDARYEHLDLVPGDVVQTVNGKPFERPEQFFAIWKQLRKANAIVVRGTRGGKPFELRFLVTE